MTRTQKKKTPSRLAKSDFVRMEGVVMGPGGNMRCGRDDARGVLRDNYTYPPHCRPIFAAAAAAAVNDFLRELISSA